MNWTPDKLERFWKACGAVDKGPNPLCLNRYCLPPAGFVGVKMCGEESVEWKNPQDCRLEILLEILKRLAAKESRFAQFALNLSLNTEGAWVCRCMGDRVYPTCTAAVISAILDLIGMEKK